MEISWIITDLDRTLLRTDKTVSEYTAQVLARCREKGIRLVAATARQSSTLQMVGHIEFDGMVLSNGAQVVADGRTVARSVIDAQTVRRVIEGILREDPSASVSLMSNGEHYCNFDVTLVWEKIEYVHTDFRPVPDVPGDKIGVGLKNGNWQRFLPYLSPQLYIQPCDGDLLAYIMHRDATKGGGILRLSREWGLDPKTAVCFGDDTNDLSMFSRCGHRVAMQNAIDEVRAAADEVCFSNDADGVAHWLEEHLL